jgi:hypothetical protein
MRRAVTIPTKDGVLMAVSSPETLRTRHALPLNRVHVQIMVRRGTYRLSASFPDTKTLPDWTQDKPAVSVEEEYTSKGKALIGRRAAGRSLQGDREHYMYCFLLQVVSFSLLLRTIQRVLVL